MNLVSSPVHGQFSVPVQPDLMPRVAATDPGDVLYTIEPSPLGPLLIAATPRGLVQVAYDTGSGHDRTLERLAQGTSARVIATAKGLDRIRRQLEQYFAGQRHSFEVSLDRRLIRPGFCTQVLEATAGIPYGTTISYGQVATAAGSPRAFRAAGNALGANPLPVIIPCHRVIPATGGSGHYTGGVERKELLLALERLVSDA